jgi:anti-sigma factor RsiW
VRGPLTEQDLTDYALNELEPHQRLYVESMLAASEECRHDICKTIEMAQWLEQGFEREVVVSEGRDLALRSEQRTKLVQPQFTARYALRDVVSALGLAACVAFGLVNFDRLPLPKMRIAAGHVADVSTKAADAMTAAVQSPEKLDLAKALASLRSLAEEGSRLMPVSNDLLPEPPTICTPPTLIMESVQLAPLGDMAQ